MKVSVARERLQEVLDTLLLDLYIMYSIKCKAVIAFLKEAENYKLFDVRLTWPGNAISKIRLTVYEKGIGVYTYENTIIYIGAEGSVFWRHLFLNTIQGK